MTIIPRPDRSDPLAEGFARILIADVDSAMRRYETEDSQQVRREMVRALFAAIEGYIWLYREHVIGIARSMGALSSEEEIVLSETEHRVNEQGKVITQPRFLPMLAAFRLTTRIASRLSPDLAINFDTGDWDRLRTAIAVRNRITHPKNGADLNIGAKDLTLVQSAFFWIMEAVIGAMEATNEAFRRQNAEFRAVLKGLQDGNPAILAEFRPAKMK